MRVYGVPNEDTAPLIALMVAVSEREIDFLLHFARVPVDALPCKLPMSLTVKAMLFNKVCVTAYQAAPGRRIEISET